MSSGEARRRSGFRGGSSGFRTFLEQSSDKSWISAKNFLVSINMKYSGISAPSLRAKYRRQNEGKSTAMRQPLQRQQLLAHSPPISIPQTPQILYRLPAPSALQAPRFPDQLPIATDSITCPAVAPSAPSTASDSTQKRKMTAGSEAPSKKTRSACTYCKGKRIKCNGSDKSCFHSVNTNLPITSFFK
ncbi:hypothetical protein BDR26DRAFT_875117 [Obelidium mucronatum]|nr:hypothetical protein BDR26DRAFT_875117 [Obelidium mucronatum]